MNKLITFVCTSFLSVAAGGMVGLTLAMVSDGFGLVPSWVLVTSFALYALAFAVSPDRSAILSFMGMSFVGSILVIASPAFMHSLFGDGPFIGRMPMQGTITPLTGSTYLDEMTRNVEKIMFFASQYILLFGAMISLCMSFVMRVSPEEDVELQNEWMVHGRYGTDAPETQD